MRFWIGAIVVVGFSTIAINAQAGNRSDDCKAELGKRLFNDLKLSQPNGQSCSTCHSPAIAFTDPDKSKPVSDGVLQRLVGFRNAPTISYQAYCPPLHYDEEGETYVGGLFWDGRADDLTLQAEAPFLNPVEMHNPDKQSVVRDVAKSNLAPLFKQVYGKNALNPSKYEESYANIADAIAAYERTPEVSPFTSKFDYYTKGQAKLTAAETRGLKLFNNKANCFACHPSTVQGDEPAALFTDFTYDNIGIPKNWDSPYLKLPKKYNPDGKNFIDYGLANTIATSDPDNADDNAGRFKVSTLRNMAITAPYGHNGYFKTMKQIVHFYNTRDVPSEKWPAGEVPQTVNHDELGNLHMTDAEENDLVTFLQTLTDGYRPPATHFPHR